MADSSFGVVDQNSPRMEPFHPTIKPSPSTPPGIPPPKRIPSTTENHENDGTQKTHNTGGDAVLISSLTDGRSMEMIRSADETGLPPDQDDKDKLQVEDVSLPRHEPTENLKRLRDGVLEQLEKSGSQIGRSTRQKIVHQSDNETGDGNPSGGLLTNSSKGDLQVFYTDDTPPREEVS